MDFYCKSKSRIVKLLNLILLLIVVVCGVSQARENGCVKIIDGDSLEIGTRRIRLLGIDAPEYNQNCFDENKKKYNCGDSAVSYLTREIKKANYDIECKSIKKDRYERELAECFVQGESLNLEMLRSGWAVTYRVEDKEYFEAENIAKNAKKGIWKGKFMRPEYYRKLNKYEK